MFVRSCPQIETSGRLILTKIKTKLITLNRILKKENTY